MLAMSESAEVPVERDVIEDVQLRHDGAPPPERTPPLAEVA